MEVGALSIQRLPLFAASPYTEIMPPWLAQQWNPAMSPHMKGKVEKKQQSLGEEEEEMAERTQHKEKTECANESHDWFS